MPYRYYCNMCSRSFRRSAELRRHTSTEHNHALERIAHLERTLEKLTGNKLEIPPSPPSSTNEHSASPEPMHVPGSEETLLDLATINAQFLFVDRAMNDVLIRLDCLERNQQMEEIKLRYPIYERKNSRCRCGTPKEKIIERRARSLAKRIEKGPQEMPQHTVSQESRMGALEMTLDRMTTGLRVALGRDTTKKVDSHHSSSIAVFLRIADMEEQEVQPSEGSNHIRRVSKYDLNNPATQIVQSQEQGEEPMEVDPTLYGPGPWDRRKKSMSEEVSRVAEKKISGHSRLEGCHALKSAWTDDSPLKSVEVGLD